MENNGRELTLDEKKAMQAAFNGKPFNPAWSAAAAKVYAGLTEAMDKRSASVPRPPEPV
ncbi:MAG TPA: hypothetical protein VIG74_01770 [Alphaproteobacteria bacterium]|jgi:hypothetical protein